MAVDYKGQPLTQQTSVQMGIPHSQCTPENDCYPGNYLRTENYQNLCAPKYGELNRFKTLMKTLPLKYEKIIPEDKYLLQSNNPPKVKIFFKENINNLKQITCFSNEGNKWRNSKIFSES